LAVVDDPDRQIVEQYITTKIIPKWKGTWQWTGIDGKERQVYLKRNRSFVDRQISRLMYQVFKRVEEDTGKTVKKVWKNGKLFLNGDAVSIQRNYSSVKAYINQTKVAEINLE